MATVFYGFKFSDQEQKDRVICRIGKDISDHPIWYGRVILQFFNTSQGEIYRVLEEGYGVRNQLWNDDEIVKINYDDRSDLSEENENNIDVVEEIDVLIKNRDYDELILK